MSLADKLAAAARFRVKSRDDVERDAIENTGTLWIGEYSFVARMHTLPQADTVPDAVREALAQALLQTVEDIAAEARRILDEVHDD